MRKGLDLIEAPNIDWLHCEPEDRQDILPFAEAFQAIRDRIGQDFSLRKLGEGAWANVFEIYNGNEGLYVVKLPRPGHLQHEDMDYTTKVKEEIALQKNFIMRYEELVKKYDKRYLELSNNIKTKTDLLDTLWGKSSASSFSRKTSYQQELEEVKKKIKILDTIQIPKLLEVYQGKSPIIVMDKIPGKSLWFEIISSVLSPLFESNYAFAKNGKNGIQKSDKSLYENCREQQINDKEIAKKLRVIEKVLIREVGRKKAQAMLFNSWMLEDDPEISVDEFIKEIDNTRKPNQDIFLQLYGGEHPGDGLQAAYDFFVEEFGIEHPDPNLYNFIITPDAKLWIIDFW